MRIQRSMHLSLWMWMLCLWVGMLPQALAQDIKGEGRQINSNPGCLYWHISSPSIRHMKIGKPEDTTTTWSGDCVEGHIHGRGKLEISIQSSSSSFQGVFRHGVLQGQGRFEGDFKFRQEFEQVTYVGAFRDGVFDGRGTMTFPNGDQYKGYFTKGKITGAGTYLIANPSKHKYQTHHEGQFIDGDLSGFGKIVFDDGTYIEGIFKDWELIGVAKKTFSDGAIYEGEFKDGKLSGKGVYIDSDGNRLVGTFLDNQVDGSGIFEFANGARYEGDFDQYARFHGKGTLRTVEGDIYVGEFAYGDRNGKGTYKHREGEVYVGEFVDGKYHGQGVLTLPNGERYEGTFEDGQRHGAGILFFSDRIYCKGEWKKGDLVGVGQGVMDGQNLPCFIDEKKQLTFISD